MMVLQRQSATATVNYSGVDPAVGLTISGGNNLILTLLPVLIPQNNLH